jgi:parallel beta-helix repeat protein
VGDKRATIILALVLCSVISISDIGVVNAEVKTIVVPDDYATIQEAIDKAFDEDIVLVKSGTHTGSVTINKSITLVGEDRSETIIIGDWSLNGTVVLVKHDGVIVKNLTIKAVPDSYSIGRGVHLLHVKNCQVLDCIFQSGIGVWLYGAINNTVKNNQILGKGSGPSFPSNTGIKLQYSKNNMITENTIKGYKYGSGIIFDSSSDNCLVRNKISNNYYEVLIRDSNNNEIRENNISTSLSIFMNPTDQGMLESYGIRLQGSSNNTIINNSVLECPKGIRILSSSFHNLIENNFISDSRYNGLEFVENANYNQVTANTIMNNWAGVNFWNSSNNIIYNNNFLNNEVSVCIYSIDDRNSFDNGTIGNYWSNYIGSDSDGDGIGNIPYVIDENNQDNFPLVNIIPEFQSWIILPLFILSTICVIIVRKKIRKKGL